MTKTKEAEKDTRGYLKHMRDLKLEYRQTYWQLRRAYKKISNLHVDGEGNLYEHPDVKTIRGMISDVNYVIEWLHTARRPGNRRGIERRAGYQREKLMDPIKMQAFLQPSAAGSPASLSDYDRERLEMALCMLSPRERECYEMAHGQGFSYSYIANMLGISKGAVEEYINRAQQKISDELRNNLFLQL